MIAISFGDVRNKKIVTPNHFISHMIEHIAWRTGLSIELEWDNQNWQELGSALGSQIKKFPLNMTEAATLGMIDDGSAIVSVFMHQAGVVIDSAGGVDLERFLGLRCEQVENGQPLVELLQGIASGLCARIEVTIWNMEDQHHTWEGIFRGLGIALNKIIAPAELKREKTLIESRESETSPTVAELVILERGAFSAKVMRGTAETGITVAVDFLARGKSSVQLEVDASIESSVKEFHLLLSELAENLGAAINVEFRAKTFSSSHVVMEDIGLVLGRALLEIIKVRMETSGVNGAGSNIQSPAQIFQEKIQAGVSIEGRKFWRFVPHDGNHARMRGNMLVGQNIFEGLRSEDLDDFVDGLSGGMTASIVLHVRDYSSPAEAWILTFRALGRALKEAFEVNPYRRGVPPGVKATLS